MANKNILVSSNAKYEPISASVDNVTGVLSSSLPVTANTSSFVAQNGLMQIYNGKLMPVANSSVTSQQDNYSASLLRYDSAEGFGPSRTADAAFSGDISGDTAVGIKVRNISNVTDGVLQSLYGGLGVQNVSEKSLITTNGTTFLPDQANKIISANANQWLINDTSVLNFTQMIEPKIYLYTGGVNSTAYAYGTGTSTMYTWTKPSGCRFVRIICQGGGGGGGGGRYNTYSAYAGGSGGGGGGYSEVIFNAMFLPSQVEIYAGDAGAGGPYVSSTNSGYISTTTPGKAGGNSSFGNMLIAYGGTGGSCNGFGFSGQTAGGIGYTYFGGTGGAGSGVAGGSVTLGGAGGGAGTTGTTGGSSAAGGNINLLSLAGGYGTSNNKGIPGTTGTYFKNITSYYLNNTLNNSFPALFCGGGGGAWRGLGADSTYGSGGGGSGVRGSTAFPIAGGGRGGLGYVLIICY